MTSFIKKIKPNWHDTWHTAGGHQAHVRRVQHVGGRGVAERSMGAALRCGREEHGTHEAASEKGPWGGGGEWVPRRNKGAARGEGAARQQRRAGRVFAEVSGWQGSDKLSCGEWAARRRRRVGSERRR